VGNSDTIKLFEEKEKKKRGILEGDIQVEDYKTGRNGVGIAICPALWCVRLLAVHGRYRKWGET